MGRFVRIWGRILSIALPLSMIALPLLVTQWKPEGVSDQLVILVYSLAVLPALTYATVTSGGRTARVITAAAGIATIPLAFWIMKSEFGFGVLGTLLMYLTPVIWISSLVIEVRNRTWWVGAHILSAIIAVGAIVRSAFVNEVISEPFAIAVVFAVGMTVLLGAILSLTSFTSSRLGAPEEASRINLTKDSSRQPRPVK